MLSRQNDGNPLLPDNNAIRGAEFTPTVDFEIAGPWSSGKDAFISRIRRSFTIEYQVGAPTERSILSALSLQLP